MRSFWSIPREPYKQWSEVFLNSRVLLDRFGGVASSHLGLCRVWAFGASGICHLGGCLDHFGWVAGLGPRIRIHRGVR